ncbi:hypothetical protein DICPUDRAFT_147335 [Dictyostelium purpureum]|uniref:Uncharacterized protein n=1 Tax=Dictyostelium purpureum TaxID=5786 RepID=F0Z889_DICPU|nr:uncharacterized protein DICPUDRAFT_147335 [Dictyostelium purpureum]EGC39852.1 hypothetical protein DICPUDRAFT_147335 [Dictyostelium purpureum]|eukprot:XP_003283603.1 hypothetical protein DICPUDRAFT_147335 [Dictyostelium purpureum]
MKKRKLKTTLNLNSNNRNIGGDFCSNVVPSQDNNNNNNNNHNINTVNFDINNNDKNSRTRNNTIKNNSNDLKKLKLEEKYKISIESSNEIKELFKQSARIVLETQLDERNTPEEVNHLKGIINNLIKELVFLMNENEFRLDSPLNIKGADDSNKNNGNNSNNNDSTITTTTTTHKKQLLVEDRLKTTKDHIESLKNIIQYERSKYKRELKNLKLLKNEPADNIETINLLNQFKVQDDFEKQQQQNQNQQPMIRQQQQQRKKDSEYPSIIAPPPIENLNFLKLNI